MHNNTPVKPTPLRSCVIPYTNTHRVEGYNGATSSDLGVAVNDQQGGEPANGNGQSGDGEREDTRIHLSSGAFYGEADGAEAGDVRELFHTPILRRVTLCV